MPFTPFHLGPGALFKAVGGRRFSFVVFGGSQVLMDIEPLVRMMREDVVLHGPSHTILGALVIALVSGLVGRPVGEFALRHWGVDHVPLTWWVALSSALVGTYSHIGLDAIMHRDMIPLWPVASGNGLLGIISTDMLHMLCLATAVLGGGIIGLRARYRPEALDRDG